MAHPKVLLVDDHQLLADALKKVLEPQFDVIGTVTDGRELVEVALHLRPDVIVLDLSLIHI